MGSKAVFFFVAPMGFPGVTRISFPKLESTVVAEYISINLTHKTQQSSFS